MDVRNTRNNSFFASGTENHHNSLYRIFLFIMFRTDGTYKFNVSLTKDPYPTKPDKGSEEYKHIYFDRTELTIDDFVSAIEAGYGYTYVYNQRHFHISYKTKDNFRYTKVLAFDIDDTDCDFNIAIENTTYPPTIAYRTYSDGVDDKCSYRFIYVFDDYINNLNFKDIYQSVSSTNSFKDLDIREINQFYFGTDKQDTYITNIIYSLRDFNVEKTLYKTHTDLIPSPDGTYYTFPDEYYEIKRLWRFDKATKRKYIQKYTDTGRLSRRKQLFIDGQLIKKINNIDSIEIMYKILKNELRLYYDNTIDIITDIELKEIAANVIKYPFKCKTCDKHPSFRINVSYWESVMSKGNDTYKPIVAINHIRKKIKIDTFKRLYNGNLSCKENMKIMEDNNFKISRKTYYNYFKEIASV